MRSEPVSLQSPRLEARISNIRESLSNSCKPKSTSESSLSSNCNSNVDTVFSDPLKVHGALEAKDPQFKNSFRSVDDERQAFDMELNVESKLKPQEREEFKQSLFEKYSFQRVNNQDKNIMSVSSGRESASAASMQKIKPLFGQQF